MDQAILKFELERVFRSDAADILAAREKARFMHHGRDVRAAGDEVEIVFRKVLQHKIPASYYIGHGHIVDKHLHQSSQLDVIIANNTGAPILFQAENGSEYFPYEGVYAIGEVKSSYDSSKQYIHAFSETLGRIHAQLQRELFQKAPSHGPFYRPYGNPLFSFMFFADAGDFHVDQIRDLYQTRPAGDLPNIVCILNKGLVVNTASHVWKNSQQKWKPAEQAQPESISLIPARNEEYMSRDIKFHWVLTEHGDSDKSLAANLANFYYPLIQHLQNCQLTIPNLTEYVNHIFDVTTSTVIA